LTRIPAAKWKSFDAGGVLHQPAAARSGDGPSRRCKHKIEIGDLREAYRQIFKKVAENKVPI
jgi:hypothetical protein